MTLSRPCLGHRSKEQSVCLHVLANLMFIITPQQFFLTTAKLSGPLFKLSSRYVVEYPVLNANGVARIAYGSPLVKEHPQIKKRGESQSGGNTGMPIVVDMVVVSLGRSNT